MSTMVKATGLSVSAKECSDGGGGDIGKPTCPFELLPELMEVIFGKLGSQDLQNCINTCEDWNQLLKSQRNIFQFELVLPIILKMKSLPFDDVLNCRFVCGKWKEGVDEVLQNHPSRLNLPEESRAFPLRATRTAGAQLQSTERLFDAFGMQIWGSFFNSGVNLICWETEEGYVDRILAHQRNPFVGRSLKLRINHWNEHWLMGKSLLEQFGEELWFLTYRIDDSVDVVMFPVEQRIREALLLLPNLKWFRLDVGLPLGQDEAAQLSILEARVPRYFRSHPLPQLQNLETFACDRFFRTPAILLSSILESCCVPDALKRLDVSNSQLKYKSSFKFPNLEELGIRMELKELASLKETSPRLKKITLIVTNRAEDGSLQSIEAGQVFGLLESFQETLIDVGIGRDCQEVVYLLVFKPGFKINLPNLELLQMDCDIPLESLEKLGALEHLWFRNYSEDEKVQVEKYKLKLGPLVPSLKTLEVDGYRSKIKMRRELSSGTLVVDNIKKYQVYGDFDEETNRSQTWKWGWNIGLVMLLFLIFLGGGFFCYKYDPEMKTVMGSVGERNISMFDELFEMIF